MSATAKGLMRDQANILVFSVASIWEVVIKHMLGRDDFRADPTTLRAGLLANGYTELPVASSHALEVGKLPPIHKDPFDRLLVAQAIVEEATLVTADSMVSQYPGSIFLV